MKNFVVKRSIKLLITALFILACSFLTIGTALASGNSVQINTLSPSQREYYALTSPIDAYIDSEIVAVVQGGSAQSLLVHTEKDGYKTMPGINLKQVKRLNQNTLIVSDSGQIKKVNIDTLTQERFDFDQPSNNFGGTFFDLNDKYLITSFSTQLDVYCLENYEITNRLNPTGISIAQESPVAINDQHYIFYVVSENGAFSIYKRSLTNISSLEIISTTNTKPTSLIANDNYVYYISGNSLIQVDFITGDTQRLLTTNEKVFDLGYLTSSDAPTNLSFNGSNLIVTDSYKQSIEEFIVKDGALEFTGFAISNNRTAFNRILEDAHSISKFGDKVAIVDSKKTTIVSADAQFNYYDENCYQNYIHDGQIPDSVTLGNHVLLSFHNTNSVAFAQGGTAYTFGNNNVKDVCYQNSNYYVLTDNGTHSKVFMAKDDSSIESASDLQFEEIIVLADIHAEIFAVDVFNNIYCYDKHDLYKNDQRLTSADQITGLATDLAGNLFATRNNEFLYLNSQNEFVNITTLDSKITSFAMDIITNKVYFLLELSQFVYHTVDLNNLFINGINTPNEFIIQGESADINDLKIYTLNNYQHAFDVSISTAINYIDLAPVQDEYLNICNLELTGINGAETFTLLVGKSGIVLANATTLTEKQVDNVSAPSLVYITTGVNAYYLPVLTKDNTYVITREDKTLRLEKGTPAIPQTKISFLGVEYYFAKLEDGTTVYIPTNFTVETLSKDYLSQTFTLENVLATDVYAFSDLTEKIARLEKGQLVKAEITDKNFVKVYLEKDSEIVIGYIPKTAIMDKANTTIRNVLVVLAVFACTAGSITFFLLRKKN